MFFLPALLGVGGGGGGGSASPSPSGSGAVSSVEPSATTPAAPSQQVYVVKAGDTLSKIAKQFGVTSEELCNANKEAIKNCDKIRSATLIDPVPPRRDSDFTRVERAVTVRFLTGPGRRLSEARC